MDRFPVIFLSSESLMTANTASHGFGLNLIRATWSQVSFSFTIVSAYDVPSPQDSHIPSLCLTSCSLTTCLLPSPSVYWNTSFMCPVSALSFDDFFRGYSFRYIPSPLYFPIGSFFYHVSSLMFQMRQ